MPFGIYPKKDFGAKLLLGMRFWFWQGEFSLMQLLH
jgi:hypothetical protein